VLCQKDNLQVDNIVQFFNTPAFNPRSAQLVPLRLSGYIFYGDLEPRLRVEHHCHLILISW
jgi:hypothetical protein